METAESLMQKFYSVEQKPTEEIASYCARTEDLFKLVVKQGGLARAWQQGNIEELSTKD
ncbi:hypothetical protein DPMN_157448 [Dreissena polymorpha]|uniref:Uncharacterized protein n=1 Tax=Dreissena polymorpha TaxID=45954 RepID=A0A9D4EFU5_DREPO|nr:hypothetical protein DPMN_157380 [Dreissena polymorpha]KAH3779643.1 hypothetical protein DPMN_157448 [Dreissena polymorpha]